jgi:hypothetical protein
MQHSAYLKLTKTLWNTFDQSPSTREKQRSDRTHFRLLYRAGKEAEIFVSNAIDSFNMKRYGGWRTVEGEGYSSFNAYVASPHTVAIKVGENADKTPIFEERIITLTGSTVHLGVQVVYGLMYLFWIPKNLIIQVGQKKLIKLMPYLERVVLCHGVVPMKVQTPVGTEIDPFSGYPVPIYEVSTQFVPLRELDTDSWWILREIVLLWLERTRIGSYKDLCKLIGDENGWDTFYSQPVPVGNLRRFRSVDELLDYFGMSDFPDDHVVVGNFKHQTGGLIANANSEESPES